MATYIISDIHGNMDLFKKMLEQIDFKSGEDFLIVNGDVLDRGDDGVEILFMVKEMTEKGDALMLKGDHELMAQMYLEGTLNESQWIKSYGEGTINGIKKLDKEKQEEMLAFIKKLELYTEADIPKYGKTVITHTGLKSGNLIVKPDGAIDVVSSIAAALENDEHGFLNSADIHYWGHERLEKLDRFIICGHVPSYQLGPEFIGKIFRSKRYMDVDAGAGYRERGGQLACYSVEEDKEYYI